MPRWRANVSSSIRFRVCARTAFPGLSQHGWRVNWQALDPNDWQGRVSSSAGISYLRLHCLSRPAVEGKTARLKLNARPAVMGNSQPAAAIASADVRAPMLTRRQWFWNRRDTHL